jgi:serine phosphatase RsbU (regulator of sigma subunit)
MTLQRGDRLVLYTDGLTDAINDGGEMFGRASLERVAREFARAPLEKMGDALFDAVARHQGDAEPFDDMTLLIVGLTP